MSKFVRYEKGLLSGHAIVMGKLDFYAGVSDSWGLGVSICFYDRSLTFNILKWYIGVEVFYNDEF